MMGALNGKRIVNTRAAHQAEVLNRLLRMQGAVPQDYPCIDIVPPEDSTRLDASLADLVEGRFDWLVLTSANTVFALSERLRVLGLTLSGGGFRVAAVGPTTAAVARLHLGLESITLPAEYVAESLANALPVEPGARVFLPESAIARPTLAENLKARGAAVSAVEAYQTVCRHGGVDLPGLLAQQQIDALTFTSSSTVTCFLERLRGQGGKLEDALMVCAACIGPATAATARDFGFAILVVPSEHTVEGLVSALVDHFAQRIKTGEER